MPATAKEWRVRKTKFTVKQVIVSQGDNTNDNARKDSSATDDQVEWASPRLPPADGVLGALEIIARGDSSMFAREKIRDLFGRLSTSAIRRRDVPIRY
jgi:hypothetical protein